MNGKSWDECTAHARYVKDGGGEVVVRCDLGLHVEDSDAGAEHHDPDLGINWRYDDELVFADD